MRSLWRKELRSMLPYLVLVVSLALIGLVYELVSGIPSLSPLAVSYDSYVANSKEGMIVVFLIAFALGSGLLIREYDEGTIEFLDSLPVSRTRIFIVKVTLALAVLLLMVTLDVGTSVVLHALSRNSLDPSFHWPLLATAVSLRMAQMLLFLSLSLALSYLRRLGWLVVGLLFWAYILILERVPAIAVLNLFALGTPHFEGQNWVVPHHVLAVQLSLSGVLLVIAYVLFTGAGDRLLKLHYQLTQSRLGNAVLLFSGIAIGGVAFSLAIYAFQYDEDLAVEGDPDEVTVAWPQSTTIRADTDHYQFLYSSHLASRGRELVTRADATHDVVRLFFEARPGPIIVVDASSNLPRHAGIAFWDRIRLDLSYSENVDHLCSVLGHETTHIYLERLSEGKLSEKFNSTRFFHEGVATYLEYREFQPKQSLSDLKSIAAVIHARNKIEFEDLTDNDFFIEQNDANLVYPLGEIFVDAIVERYGASAVPQIVRALVREKAPAGLHGMTLWRDTLQSCDFNLDQVIGDYFVKLDREVERHRELVNHLPRLRGIVSDDEDWVSVAVLWEPIDDWTPICRFRQAADSEIRHYFPGIAGGEDVFIADRDSFPDGTFWYQLGLTDGGERVIYEKWERARLTR